jgi:hypothetical protein
VLTSVDLNDESAFSANKVYDEWSDWFLANELKSAEGT